MDDDDALRSSAWFAQRDVGGLIHRAYLRSEGISAHALQGRPIVGICNSWSELVNCNLHLRGLVAAVKRGVMLAGGLPLEFPTMSLGEPFMKPTAMLYRNLMSMDVEESIRANPLDAVVLLAACDKTVPAQLMGAASADVPAIMLTGGPMSASTFRGRPLASGSDLWTYTDDLRAGRMDEDEYGELELALTPTSGHCMELGTASTMAAIVEALGMSLPGSAAVPAVHARRAIFAEQTGRRAVELARAGPRPSEILTLEAFTNAVRVLMAAGGSTNAVLHLTALAGRVGVALPLELFDEISRGTPRLLNLRPAGEFLFEDLDRAGGVPALLRELLPLLDGGTRTVSGCTVAEIAERARVRDASVIRPLADPLEPDGGIAVLRGSLAPGGALLKQSAASPALRRHRGSAVVFEDIHHLLERIDAPDVEISEGSVLVLKSAGPRGGYGMPEWGQLPIPRRLLEQGVRDLVRVSDGRMSGTAGGTVVLHVTPESATDGPLRAVRDGDPIALDVDARRIDLEVAPDEVARRLAALGPPAPRARRGYAVLHDTHVLGAEAGCDFDFLRNPDREPAERLPAGLLRGWITGW
jgi:dihydroxy-acid dehydratase